MTDIDNDGAFTLRGMDRFKFDDPIESDKRSPYSSTFSLIAARQALLGALDRAPDWELKEIAESGAYNTAEDFRALAKQFEFGYILDPDTRKTILTGVLEYLADYPDAWLQKSLDFAIKNPIIWEKIGSSLDGPATDPHHKQKEEDRANRQHAKRKKKLAEKSKRRNR